MVANRQERASDRGLGLILIVTGFAGIGGYAITTLVARGLGPSYGLFAIFWSALYLILGALAGVQQEIARATHPRAGNTARPARLPVLVGAICVVVLAVVGGSSLVWAGAVFGNGNADLAGPLAVGASIYVLVAAAIGTLYGIHRWKPLALVIGLDVALRLILLVIGLAIGANVATLAWLTIAPFPILVVLVLLVTRGELVSRTRMDLGYPELAANITRTVLAAGATAVLVSGFPLLLGITSPTDTRAALSAVIFTLTLTRAPLVVSTLALQSYFVVNFRDHATGANRRLVLLIALVGAGGLFLAVCAWWIGPDIVVALTGETFRVSGMFLGLLVASSILTAWLALTGAAVLAKSRHSAYSAGWVVAAVTAVLLLLFPGDIQQRSLLALCGAPFLGLIVHIVVLWRSQRPIRSVGPHGE